MFWNYFGLKTILNMSKKKLITTIMKIFSFFLIYIQILQSNIELLLNNTSGSKLYFGYTVSTLNQDIFLYTTL